MRLLGSLALLMFGMKLMSETLQKMAGPQLRHVLGRMTTNRFTGMLTGIGVTAAVQSSTATTVMTVSFVSAGLLTLAQAISIIMGANIWAGSTFNITDFVWPAFLVALILIYRQKGKNAGDFIFGLSFLLLGLGTLRQTGADMHLDQNEAVVNFFSSFDPESFRTTILFLLIGGILTMCVQSSAAVMAITMLLCSSGALPIYQGIALVMGENIGTTVTSNIVAYSAGTQARRAAFAHMFFNLFGVFWVLLIFRPFVNMVCWIAGDNLSMVLATFHTCFNVINTGILIWFIPQIERLVCRVIKSKPQNGEDDEEPTRLRYINGGLMETPEISLLQAQKEIGLFGKRTQRMFGMVRELLHMKPGEDFVKLFSRIEKYEGISDNMEFEIGHYLEQVSDAHLSDESKMKIRRMLREISELESIGDACYNMARTLNRKQEGIEDFTPAQYDHLEQLMQLCDDSLTQMNITMTGPREEFSLNRTQDIELAINALRAELKSRNLDDVNAHQYSYTIGTTYTDLLNECEKLGDYVVNVVEARLG